MCIAVITLPLIYCQPETSSRQLLLHICFLQSRKLYVIIHYLLHALNCGAEIMIISFIRDRTRSICQLICELPIKYIVSRNCRTTKRRKNSLFGYRISKRTFTGSDRINHLVKLYIVVTICISALHTCCNICTCI